MIKVGITGGIGSGKTLICEMFKVLGIPVFHADSEAKNLINTIDEIRESLIDKFGSNIYSKDGLINKARFGEIIFNDKNSLDFTNKIIHPHVVNEFNNWAGKHLDKPYVLHEAAILFESGVYKEMDKIIYVVANENTRVSRVMKRDGISFGQVKSRISNQWSVDKIKDKVHFFINNDGDNLIIAQVLEIHKNL